MLRLDAEFARKRLALTLIFLAAACGDGSSPPPPVATVIVSPSSPSVIIGATQQFTAATMDANGAAVTGRTVTWSSSNNTTATVSSTGLATTLAVGSATITATSETQIGSTTLTVIPIPVATVTITPPTATVEFGKTVQLTAVTKDAAGNTLTGRTVTWSSSSLTAGVTSNGLVTGQGAGTATITAESGLKTGTATVTVTALVVSYEYYKRFGTATPATATLTLPNGIGNAGTLSIDGKTITTQQITGTGTGSRIECLFGPAGSAITSCAGTGLPRTLRLCGPDANGTANVLVYVMFEVPDTVRMTNTSAALLAAVQTDTRYLGIGVFPDCGQSLTTSWVRNAPNTNYFLWPNVIQTYTPAAVSALLSGAVIYSTLAPGSDYNKFVALRVSSTVFEVWH